MRTSVINSLIKIALSWRIIGLEDLGRKFRVLQVYVVSAMGVRVVVFSGSGLYPISLRLTATQIDGKRVCFASQNDENLRRKRPYYSLLRRRITNSEKNAYRFLCISVVFVHFVRAR